MADNDAKSRGDEFVICKQVETRPVSEAVLCVRVHRADGSSGPPRIVAVRVRGGDFDVPDDAGAER